MTTGISAEHAELHRTVDRWTEARCGRDVVRAALAEQHESLPPFWDELASQGWLSLHIPERWGGQGFGLAEAAIVVEELGRACAPGPYLSTMLAAAAICAGGDDELRERWLPGLADGSLVGAFGAAGGPVAGAGLAEVVVLLDGAQVVAVERAGLRVTAHPSLDALRPAAAVEVVEPDLAVPLTGSAGLAGPVLAAADAVGGMAWCVDTAAAYATQRVQFGRPIGQFQAVKHRCADMLLRLELSRAAAWDAARCEQPDELELVAAVASAIVPEAYLEVAEDCIQVLGGVGYTWEHDAHLYLKRAASMQLLFPPTRRRVAELALEGRRRTLSVPMPPEADEHRTEVRAFVDELRATDRSTWNRRLADAGYLVPHWPRPWGRGAGPLEQLVIDEELRAARIRRPHLRVAGWVLPTLVAHGTPEQQERWVGPTLRGELTWCQMFSEPGAGSDLASLSTRAERVEGGWSLTGQKVWTTLAHVADLGLCLARTGTPAGSSEADEAGEVDRHRGITCFVVDLHTPGLDVRPLRELTGHELFNEVFLDAVFVPDDAVVGEVGEGWAAARTTLANERVAMASGSSFGPGVEALLGMPGVRKKLPKVGRLVAEGQALAVLGLRSTLRALDGAEPGPESSVRKLLGVEHDQRIQELGLALLGPWGAVTDGDAALWVAGFLGNRALSIAGGTSDVQRNIIAERLLGLPRDP